MYAVPRLVLTVESVRARKLKMILTVSVYWHVQIPNLTVHTKDLSEMVLINVFSELLDNNLGGLVEYFR
jgi:hypothetical protein